MKTFRVYYVNFLGSVKTALVEAFTQEGAKSRVFDSNKECNYTLRAEIYSA